MTDETCAERKLRHVCLHDVASRQWGNVTTEQLRACGYTGAAITRAVAAGKLNRVLPRTYSVGYRSPAPQSRWAAALLYAGDIGALGHWTSLANLGLRGPGKLVHVVVPKRVRTQPGFRFHLSAQLRPDEITVANGLRTTTIARTLLDLSAAGTDVGRLVADAVARRMTTPARLRAYLDSRRGARGADRLRRAVDGELTRSGAEQEFIRWLRSRNLPVPSMNHPLGAYTVDGLWEDAALVVEIDTYGTHGSPHSFEDDRVRDAFAAAKGFRTLRVTPRRWREDGDRLERDIRAARAHGLRNLR